MNTVLWLIGLCCAVFISHGVEASHPYYRNFQSLQSTSIPIYQPYRTGYHFQPSKNYMNDPNAPNIYNGIYHLFYQWSTLGAVWGNVVWAHATSTDLVNWIHHNMRLSHLNPTFVQGKPIIQYTGIIKSNQWNYQVEDMAVPKNLSDPYLVEWVKPIEYNPVIKPTGIINASAFRDPTTGWQGPDGIWRLTIGSKVGNNGISFLYRSDDFIHWTKAEHGLHWAKDTGMWECPDFFPVAVDGKEGLDTSVLGPNVKHVFKVSLDDTKHDYYTIGTYNPEKDKYTPDEGSIDNDSGLRYDYGKFYASKTFFDHEKNRRVLWGWANESSSVADDVKKGWAGLQAVSRTLWLAENGKQLKQWPVKEIEQLRTKRADVDVIFKLPKLEEVDIMDPSWVNPQLLCSSKPASVQGKSGPFGLLAWACKNFEERTAIFLRVFNHQNKYVVLMCSDQSMSSLEESNDKTTYGAFIDVDPHDDHMLSLRSLIDRSIVESYGVDGKAVITARVYPKLAIGNEARLYVFNNGTENVKMSSMKAWSMKKAEIKYLKDLEFSDI
ncbi:hypothetical protein MKW98_016106 [Papaver atlanticum]|uniref:Beta-fructofuranosidase n=1 Tax=Papaver atlanticum TaxID=357466 RepID=A0AAD4XNZ8_9MAGN|nr:hypothetical protein MKW98_016106 [Papaver atlanticum]